MMPKGSELIHPVRRVVGVGFKRSFWPNVLSPLFYFNQIGFLKWVMLRYGNIHSADDWWSTLEPVLSQYREKLFERYFLGDALFDNPDIYEFFKEESYCYAIRLKGNNLLH